MKMSQNKEQTDYEVDIYKAKVARAITRWESHEHQQNTIHQKKDER